MVLAAVVNAAVASPVAATSLTPEAAQSRIANNLSWAVSGAAAAQDTRVFLAEQAVQAIHSFDRLCGAELHAFTGQEGSASFSTLRTQPVAQSARPRAEDHARSTHQNSAP